MANFKNRKNISKVKELEYTITNSKVGFLIKKIKSDKVLDREIQYVFKNGLILKKDTRSYYGGIETLKVEKFNEKEFVIERIEYDKYSCIKESCQYTRDYKGHIIKSIQKDEKGERIYERKLEIKHFHDDSKYGIDYWEYVDEFCDGTFTGRTVRTYDKLNRILSTDMYNGKWERNYEYKYRYNDFGQNYYVSIYSKYNSPPWHECYYRYNSKGDIIECEKKYRDDPTVKVHWEYEYDHMDNWIKRNEIREGELRAVAERYFTYG